MRFFLNSGRRGVSRSFKIAVLLCLVTMRSYPQAGIPGAVSQQAAIDAQAQQLRDRQAQQLGQTQPVSQSSVDSSAISQDLGSLQLMREIPSMPFARLRVDQTYNWLSNASYAKNSEFILASWQSISSLEAAWAPMITTMPEYQDFFPEAGVRASFFNYFQQEEPTREQNALGLYDFGLVQDFTLVNLFTRASKKVSDELTVGLSFDYNTYFWFNSPDARAAAGQSGDTNFLNEFIFAYNANFMHSFTDRQAVAINWRASYVFTDPTYYTRTDNSLTGTYFINLSEKLSLSPFASYRLAYYTQGSAYWENTGLPESTPNGFYRRLDQQYTLGLGLNFALSPELSTGLSLNYSKSDSTSRIAETGDFTNLTAGANWSMTYKFSEKEFVVTERNDCLGPFVRTDLGFSFDNNLQSSPSLSGEILPGISVTLSDPSIALNPGVRFDVTPGYNFNDWLGAEFSAGILYNGLDHLNGNGSVTIGDSSPIPVGAGGTSLTGRFVQVPVMLSSVFRWPGKGRWKPYLSTGFGFAYSQLQITQVGEYQTSDQFSQQFSPAFSVGSGFYWQVSDMVDFDVMYKLLGLINPGYSDFHPGVPLSNSLQFGINVRF